VGPALLLAISFQSAKAADRLVRSAPGQNHRQTLRIGQAEFVQQRQGRDAEDLRSTHYEGHSKDYEFSRLTMEEHWRAGYHDGVRTLRHPEVLERPSNLDGAFTFDLGRDGRE
jgi:hypothetical protein